jgi:hypothetical protein
VVGLMWVSEVEWEGWQGTYLKPRLQPPTLRTSIVVALLSLLLSSGRAQCVGRVRGCVVFVLVLFGSRTVPGIWPTQKGWWAWVGIVRAACSVGGRTRNQMRLVPGVESVIMRVTRSRHDHCGVGVGVGVGIGISEMVVVGPMGVSEVEWERWRLGTYVKALTSNLPPSSPHPSFSRRCRPRKWDGWR